ncbi:disintegrin and metalloproteinase domain-containing protein 30-like [Dromiciops gliroides]|uniref:disintegrin and metalloproteinase domain-containing protein 30-like n=1 Tax=Dromiciops gliroides TaxID=33562 RepID=UPI001CC3D9BD|nr:disintegrin and metalloproteinase domain-containing protein 30-like [Dromiciops gliroides]
MRAAVTGAAPFLCGPLLVLGLGALLAPANCLDMSLQRPPVSAELVIPKEISPPLWTSKMSGQVSYSLHITGKKHIVHLLPKKMLLPRHLPVFTHAAKGVLQEDPFFRNDCYYYGYMEGIPKSSAALSTCLGGLWGMLQVNEKYYQIQPDPASSTFEHHLYPMTNTGASNLTRALAREEIEEDFFQAQETAPSRRTATYDVHLHRQYVEMGVVVGKVGHKPQDSNVTVMLQDMLFTLNLVDTLFMQIQAHASLSSLEFWTSPSPMDIIKKLQSVLHYSAKQENRSPGEQQLCDLVQLFQQHSFYPIFGIDARTAKCNPYPGLAIKANFGVHLLIFSVLVSCEMRDDLGKPGDEGNLQSQRKPCLIGNRAPTSGSFKSSCTFDGHMASVGSEASCLSGTSEERMEKQKCGNKVMEEGEECDCGSDTECIKNPCCQQGCTLSKGAECSSGLCCKDCKILPAGRVCRIQANECDLPEFCNGTSGFCPDDIYKQDGTPCSGKGYCYKKQCGSHLRQCQALFGPQAESAPPQCYKEVNSRGDRFGNCGPGQISYFKGCKTQNILCGRLQCVNIDIIPQVPHYYTLIQTYLKEPLEKEGVLCWGTAFNKTAENKGLTDLGAVEDGSSCGENMMCVNKTCLNISSRQECVPEQCNYRGVCNSRGNCHCDFGWAPPFCQDPGYGGSIDSGPMGDLGIETNTSFLSWRTYLIRGSICSSFVMLKWAVIMLYKKRKWKKP